mgnify:CR=1 FL=1
MKHIYLNLKRFDIPKEMGGVNRIAPVQEWGTYIVENTKKALAQYGKDEVEFVMYLPEAHLLPAIGALDENGNLAIGGLHQSTNEPVMSLPLSLIYSSGITRSFSITSSIGISGVSTS